MSLNKESNLKRRRFINEADGEDNYRRREQYLVENEKEQIDALIHDNLQISCGLSDLELFQLHEQQLIADTELAIRLSEQEAERRKPLLEAERISNKHFEEVFIPSLRDKTSLTFEQFCVVLIRGMTQRCGACAVYRDRRFQSGGSADEQQDPLFDFCPHLICSEWSILGKLRLISNVFWQRFLQTRVGRNLMICFPRCKYCYWTSLFDVGHSRKVHIDTQKRNQPLRLLRLPMSSDQSRRADDFTPRCFCTSPAAEQVLRDWCKKAGIAEKSVVVYPCRCDYSNAT